MRETFCEPSHVLDNLGMTRVQLDISLSTTVVCTDNNLSCDLKGEAVILNLESGIYFGLNQLGARIWELIQKPVKVSDVQRELLKEYEIDPSQCQEDLLSFLHQLIAQSLVRVCGEDE